MNNNVIEFEKWKESNEELLMMQSESIKTIIPVVFVYGDDTGELFGTLKLFGTEELASIEVLRREIKEQEEAIMKGFNKYGDEIEDDEINPWGEDEFIVCKEGIFHWDWKLEDYEYFGQVEGFVKKKVVTMLKDVVIYYGVEHIHLYRGASYHVSGEYIAYDNEMQPLVMLSISPEGCIPIAVPYEKEKLTIFEADFAVMNLLSMEEI
ncbi:hypothetical protein SAMN05880501_11765 [Ureibacillus xyleni]|uniref:Uncharacterized protein n=1 Tax=Ureibacillus xyleni TaxID=614648 RepID=A0A285TP08_9BACL|nr:hypothetical protein [Ureibacillus xyleni]SOC24609.1 hypothetical protein SAMN05880501_11765 [Ureibacillus xyleni]